MGRGSFEKHKIYYLSITYVITGHSLSRTNKFKNLKIWKYVFQVPMYKIS